MRILLATARNPRFPTITEYIERALRSLGHEVRSFDDRRLPFPSRLRSRFPVLGRCALGWMNRRLTAVIRTQRPDMLLCAGGERILPTTVQNARASGTATALWTIDTVKPEDPRVPLARHFDFVFCGGTEMIQALNSTPVHHPPCWLPFACDPEFHHPVELGPEERGRYGHDLVFVGSLHPELYARRVAMLEALADLDLGVWGPGAGRLPRASPVRARVRGEDTSCTLWTRLYSAAKIVLCVHYSGPGPWSRQASPRVYEALACGAFLLCDDCPDALTLFEEGRDLVIFRDPGELRDKARYYLSHEGERARIAEHGRRGVLARHTYRHRAERIVDTVGRGR